MSPMSPVYAIADKYVEHFSALNPIEATMLGVHGYNDKMTDYSPDGVEAQYRLCKSALSQLAAAEGNGERDRIAREVMRERLGVHSDQYRANEHYRSLNILTSPLQMVRMAFDLMPGDTLEDWQNVATRLALVPNGIESYQTLLNAGLQKGTVSARRQALSCALQAETWGGGTGQPSFFSRLVDAYDNTGIADQKLRDRLTAGAQSASAAYIEIAGFLRNTYAPTATERDGIGKDRYRLYSLGYNGAELDMEDTYAWGWEQLGWVEAEMKKTAAKILPGANIEEVKQLLETDPARSIEGVEEFQRWMQGLQDRTIAKMNGVHFDIPTDVQRIEAMIAPPGGALAMYYTPPSEDFSRPGRTWYPTNGKTRFPIWGEVSIAYHEGVPGHHFQLGMAKHMRETLSRFQRTLALVSGYSEGWALYAERLMGELGYLEYPDYYFGMLRAQALRSVRVIVDIGMHLQLKIPRGQKFHPGAVWTPDLGHEFLLQRSHFPPDFLASELTRYLGLPAQAISYKVGERAWLQARDAVKSRLGAKFDLRAWHNKALNLGPMGLEQMREEMGA